MLASIFQEAVQRAGRTLEYTAEEVEPGSLGETKHLTPALKTALAETAARLRIDPGDLAGRKIPLSGWPRVGAFDLRLDADSGRVALLELKWGALDEVVWDVCKLALAVTELKALIGFVVVGARDSDWNAGRRGAELLDTARHRTADLRAGRYQGLWDGWHGHDPRPGRLPPVIRVEEVTSVELDLRGESWRLRCASVVADPGLVEDVDDLDERWEESLTPVTRVFYDEALTSRDKRARLAEITNRSDLWRNEAADDLRSLDLSERLAAERAGEQGEEPDPEVIERMLRNQAPG